MPRGEEYASGVAIVKRCKTALLLQVVFSRPKIPITGWGCRYGVRGSGGRGKEDRGRNVRAK